ncbi:MAG TPA: energy transducer TonB [Blastocatellia bacterium]|jgi:TonB family protein|nr:energy transducer TonB [Blastocatellia bacterium]
MKNLGKNLGRKLLSSVCVLAMVANSLAGVMSQDRKGDGKAVADQTGAELVATVNGAASDPAGGAPRAPQLFNSGFANADQQGGDSAFQFFSQEMSFDNRLVKGAPFSANIASETIQTLPDGNRIVQRSEGRIYRDSQGRTRSERTFQMGGSSEQRQVINVIDPVANASYSLDPESRIARKNNHFFGGVMTSDLFLTPPFNPDAPSYQPRGVPVGVPGGVSKGVAQGEVLVKTQPIYPPTAKQINASGKVEVAIIINEYGRVMEAKAISGHPVLRSAAEDAARKWVFKPTEVGGKPVQVQGTLVFIFAAPPPSASAPSSASANDETSKKISVSGVVLQSKAIRKVQPPYPPIARAARASGAVQVQITISEIGEVIDATAINGHPLLRDAALQAARQWLFKPTELGGVPIKVQGILTFNFTLSDEEPSQAQLTNSVSKYPLNTEQLGKRKIEGIECEGIRVVATMPAGAIGNERPIETVNETWYSLELQMMILSKRSDPRFGESTYQVTNIIRSEPDATLFQIPSDYTVIDSAAKKVEIDVKEFEEIRRKLEEAKKQAEGARKPDNQ